MGGRRRRHREQVFVPLTGISRAAAIGMLDAVVVDGSAGGAHTVGRGPRGLPARNGNHEAA